MAEEQTQQGITSVAEFKEDALGKIVDSLMAMSADKRRKFERRWYENNFFDDGFHFRFISRATGRIVDLSQRSVGNLPIRAIPKASRQIRGIANLLLGPTYVPVVYPEKAQRANYSRGEAGDDLFEAAQDDAKDAAKRSGHWIMEEWKKHKLNAKLTLMAILAAKHSVSFMQIWPDAIAEEIKTRVYDAFDIYLAGDVQDLQDSPYMIKSTPQTIAQVRANELFDKDKVAMISPDNRFASSELKDAYKRATFGTSARGDTDETVTILLKEAFIKEYVNENNKSNIPEEVLKDKENGDVVMRHVFTAGGISLRDEYLKIDKYPFVEFRYEPGPLYQTPLIERFIPMNKSLDIVLSRVERYINTMVSGHWLKRRGEDLKISNIPGGQVLEFQGSPPIQGNIAPLPQTVQQYINQIESMIEEQGASTAALGQLPPGVKSGVAIEALKETEFLNLKIAADQMKMTVKKIAEAFFNIAASEFVKVQTVERLEKGEPDYFDIIGEVGMEIRQEIGDRVPEGTVILQKDMNVDIEVESGAGFTRQGQRETAQQLATFVLDLAGAGMVSQETVNLTIEKLFEIFGFGNTQELAEALEKPTVAQAETAEAGAGAQDEAAQSEQRIAEAKVAVIEVLKEAGLIGGGQSPQGGA